jgi:hypothetical protein
MTYVANNKKCFVIHMDLIMWYSYGSKVIVIKQSNARKVSWRWKNQGDMKIKNIKFFVVECRWIVVSGHKNDVEEQECNLSHAHMPITLVGGVQIIFLVNLVG